MNALISFLEKTIPFSDQKLIAAMKFFNKLFLVLAFLGTIGTIGFAFYDAYDRGSFNAERVAELEEALAQDRADQAKWEAEHPDNEYYGNAQYIEEELAYFDDYGFSEAMLDFGIWLILGSIIGFVLIVLYYRLMKIILHSLDAR